MRDLHYRPQVQLLDGCTNGGRWGRGRLLCYRGIALVELTHLTECAPTQITVTGIAEVRIRHFLDAALQIELPSQLVGDTSVLDKPIFVSSPDGFLVQPHGVEVP